MPNNNCTGGFNTIVGFYWQVMKLNPRHGINSQSGKVVFIQANLLTFSNPFKSRARGEQAWSEKYCWGSRLIVPTVRSKHIS